MPRCSFEVTCRSDARPERVFELLADATSWPRWASPLIGRGGWAREGDPPPGGVGAIRKVGRPPVYAYEEIVEYRPPERLAYTIPRGQPVRNYRAVVDVSSDGDGTRVEWRATFDPLLPGTGAIVTATYRSIIGWMARRLAAYAARD